MKHNEFIRIVPESEKAILFIHGIAGTPNHFDEFIGLVPKDVSVYNMLLDGHGKKTRDFSASSMRKWKEQVRNTVDELLKEHKKIYIAAHSMGTLFAIGEAVEKAEIEKLFLLAVPIKLFVRPAALFSAFKIYLGKVSENDLKTQAMKNCCGIELSKNPFEYLGWIPRFLELFDEIGKTKKVIPKLKTNCRIYQSKNDELVSLKSVSLLRNKTKASVKVLEKSGHYYYDKDDFDFLLNEFREFVL
ncbi:MAG: alpha/beta fold hydrolase [Oscillospiraceae bacterium]|nr:alpha/beta fold hydrolase [Oscillospiraceae bacterium]